MAMLKVTVCLLAVATLGGAWDSAMNAGLVKHLLSRGIDPTQIKTPVDQWCPLARSHSRFTQRLDHFNPQNTATFQQRYQTNGTFFKPGGPVFVLLGGEGPANGIW